MRPVPRQIMLARMPGSTSRSISIPIVLSSIAVLLTLALLVGWILVIRENAAVTQAIWDNTWLLIGGIVSLALVMSVLVLFSVSLVREILEGRRQQVFIDSVTHELKSPLASIKLCLDTLGRDGLSDRQQGELKQMMRTDVERLSLFVDDILQASRIAHRLRSQTWLMVDVTQLLTSTIESIRQRYGLSESDFTLLAPSRLETFTDPTALEIILKNLLDNAVKYSSPAPQIEVTLKVLDTAHLTIVVRDHGIGIERGQLKRIFRRFHRAPDPRVNERSGSGLGLYVVHRLVRNLGGRIRAESPGPGLGTTFSIRLPLSAATRPGGET
jgi:signal transduction histidine kinase